VISEAARQAFDAARSAGLVAIRSDLAEGEDGEVFFEVEFSTPHPNQERLGPDVPARIVLPRAFPWAEAKVYLQDKGDWRFPHMGLNDGKLCLPAVAVDPVYPGGTVVRAIVDAKAWLEDAGNGCLLKPGEHWELPDFKGKAERPKNAMPVWVLESANSFPAWVDQVGQCGDVLLTRNAHGQALVPFEFVRADGEVIQGPWMEPDFLRRAPVIGREHSRKGRMTPKTGSAKDGAPLAGPQVRGKWLLLPSLIYRTHRPPKTFKELDGMCKAAGIDLWALLGSGGRWDDYEGMHYILVGSPIPEVVGQADQEVHWQPVTVPAKWVGSTKRSRSGQARPEWLATSLPDQVIPWGKVENVATSRVGARGHYPDEVTGAKIAVVGAGAIGSMVVDHLVRGGVCDLAIFDFDAVEHGNLSRHTLGSGDVGHLKAAMLSRKYEGFSPDLHIRWHAEMLPVSPQSDMGEAGAVLLRADVWVDCTGNSLVRRWLSRLGKEHGKKVIQVFTNPDAWNLAVLVSGSKVGLTKVKDQFEEDLQQGRAGIPFRELYPDTPEIPVGAGCWHPSFPAIGSDIQALVAAAMPLVAGYVGSEWKSRGRAIVLRRKPLTFSDEVVRPVPLIEVAWNRSYR